jgi:hypothetical protein
MNVLDKHVYPLLSAFRLVLPNNTFKNNRRPEKKLWMTINLLLQF